MLSKGLDRHTYVNIPHFYNIPFSGISHSTASGNYYRVQLGFVPEIEQIFPTFLNF